MSGLFVGVGRGPDRRKDGSWSPYLILSPAGGGLPSAPFHHVTWLSRTTQNPQPASRGPCDLVSLHSPKLPFHLHTANARVLSIQLSSPPLLCATLGQLDLMPLHARCWPATRHPPTSGLRPAGDCPLGSSTGTRPSFPPSLPAFLKPS